ncbi:MAG: 2-dehydropantoate 2-reductase [Acidobacteriota bacterium]|nr:2-dehydropantoate 2-reductase [Acidobacteriota bacterium]
MKFAVVGVGGVGGYYGGRLAAGHCDVSFLARGRSLQTLLAHGLSIESALGDVSLHDLKTTDRPDAIGPVDVVLLCVKAYDLESVATSLAPLLHDDTAVLCTQNGVDAVDRLTPLLTRGHLLGAVVYGNTMLTEPGKVTHVGTLARLRIGGRDDLAQELAAEVSGAFRSSGVDAQVADDIDAALWSKFVLFSVMSAASCLADLATGPLRVDPDYRAMLKRGMRETAAVARAHGVKLEPDIAERSLSIVDEMAAESVPSMLLDLRAGRRLEIEYLSGTVVRLGNLLGIDVPFHSAAYGALKHQAKE